MATTKVFCAVVGETTTFSVKIDGGGVLVSDLKEAIKTKKCYPFPAHDLELYPAKKDNGDLNWLVTENDVKNGIGHTKGLTHLETARAQLKTIGLLEKDVRVEATNEENEKAARGEGPVNVLVKNPLLPSWELVDTTCDVLPKSSEQNEFLFIPENYVHDSGLQIQKGGLLLFQRQAVQDEWAALWNFTVKTYAVLSIVGPPGTGKSCAAFAFACSLKRVVGNERWDVVWIHYEDESDELSCILFREKWTCTIKPTQLESLFTGLSESNVVFLDGYVEDRPSVLHSCRRWREENVKKRRLVVVCSMISVGKDWRLDLCDHIPSTVESRLECPLISSESTMDTPSQTDDEQCFMTSSWTLEEYRAAITNDRFFDRVKVNFITESTVEMARRMEQLSEKFFVCGGNARMMFGASTEAAKEVLRGAVHSTEDIHSYFNGTIAPVRAEVHQLLSWYPKGSAKTPFLISTFVAREIGSQESRSIGIHEEDNCPVTQF